MTGVSIEAIAEIATDAPERLREIMFSQTARVDIVELAIEVASARPEFLDDIKRLLSSDKRQRIQLACVHALDKLEDRKTLATIIFDRRYSDEVRAMAHDCLDYLREFHPKKPGRPLNRG